jgi:lysophospholipase L1-like esterase
MIGLQLVVLTLSTIKRVISKTCYMKIHYCKNILVATISILTTLVLLEVGLWITGATYMQRRSHTTACEQGDIKDAYVILCLGNSWTLGIGAPPGMSYPDHLSRMLKAACKDKYIKVINGGVASLNSAEMLERLQAQITSIKPDLIILRTGQPNTWNENRYSQHLHRENKLGAPLHIVKLSVNDFFYKKSRIYKFIKLLFFQAAQKNKAKHMAMHDTGENAYMLMLSRKSSDDLNDIHEEMLDILYEEFMPKDEYQNAMKLSSAIGLIFSPIASAENPLGIFTETEIKEAIHWHERAIQSAPHLWHSYESLGNIYFYKRDYKKAAEFYMAGINAGRCFSHEDMQYRNLNLSRLRYLYHELRASDHVLKKGIQEFAKDFIGMYPEKADMFLWIYPERLDDSKISSWIESDVKEIVRLIKAENINLIIHNYPPIINEPEDGRTLSNIILRKAAIKLMIPFVDHEILFLELYNQGYDPKDYYQNIAGIRGDHFNEQGYMVMAEYIYNKIIEEGFIMLGNE